MKFKKLISENEHRERREQLRKEIELLEKQLIRNYPALLHLHIYITSNMSVYIGHIVIKPELRGKGIGSEVLKHVLKFADQHGLITVLSPSPEPKYKEKLLQFYKSFGFINNKGRKKRYDLSSMFGPTMYRLPKKSPTITTEIKNDTLYDLEAALEELAPDGNKIIQHLHSIGHTSAEEIDILGNKLIVWEGYIVDPEYPTIYEKEDWIFSSSGTAIARQLLDIEEKKFNDNFWKFPVVLFHATKTQHVASIKQYGLKASHQSRGLSNTHIDRAVFTSTEPEWATFSYGPVEIVINTKQMKQDGFTPFVTKEPNHTHSDIINYIARKIKAWEDDRDFSGAEGTTDDTVIIHDSIPPKYLIFQ